MFVTVVNMHKWILIFFWKFLRSVFAIGILLELVIWVANLLLLKYDRKFNFFVSNSWLYELLDKF